MFGLNLRYRLGSQHLAQSLRPGIERVLGRSSDGRDDRGLLREGGCDDQLAELEASEHDTTAEVGEVAPVRSINALDETVGSEALEAARDPDGRLRGRLALPFLVSQAADRELAGDNGGHDEVIISRDEVEAAVVAPVLDRRLGDLAQRLCAGVVLRLAWQDCSDDPACDFAFASRGGGGWATPPRINDEVGSAGQYRPKLAVDGSGRIYAAWTDRRNGDYGVFFSWIAA